ncbi:MAG TPA: zinc ribbon domain-containing protein [Candidatus Saccharimonadales bacterium]|nr:zinc ribbon domain-containing protein [Candidatus Saccharimonadales bacterium]
MNCPNCQQIIEPGAAFCGNCGQSLQATSAADTKSPAHGLPAYAAATPVQQGGETKAVLSTVFGPLGVVGAIFIPIIGVACGIVGVVLGTMARPTKKAMGTVGVSLSSLAILAGLATWVYAVQQAQLHSKTAANVSHQLPSASVAANGLSTPCYTTGFAGKFNVSNSNGSCDMAAFNGASLTSSTNIYKIYANKSNVISDASFNTLAKQAIEKDVHTNLAGFKIVKEQATQFSGSTAYEVTAVDKSNGTAVLEAAVYHPTASGYNVFVIVHAIVGDTSDLQTLEGQWQWN